MTDKPYVRGVDAAQLFQFGHFESLSNEYLVKVVDDTEVDKSKLRLHPSLIWLNMMERFFFKSGMLQDEIPDILM